MSRMVSLDDIKKRDGGGAGGGRGGGGRDDGKRDPKKAPNTLYTGSGQNVLGRPGDDDDEEEDGDDESGDVIQKIFKQTGVGGEGARGAVTIRFYKNGFTVDDGELRKLEDPANRQFLADINGGRVPSELTAGGGRDLDVSVEDHRSEDYVAPPYRAFSGSGAASGRAAPAPTGAVVRAAAAGAVPDVDAGAPTTVIAVTLMDGRRERVTLNLSHTVAHLQAKVASLNGSGGKPFVLMAGFPPKPLADGGATVEAAGLKGAAVKQAAA